MAAQVGRYKRGTNLPWTTAHAERSAKFASQDSSVPDAKLPEVTPYSRSSSHDERSELWNKQYLRLKAFYEEHGHIAVPRAKDKSLSDWIRRQRVAFRKQGTGSLPEGRVQKLLELGFSFNTHDKAWREKFEQLKVYKAEYGDTLVPVNFPSNPELGNWVDMQRQHYSSRAKGDAHSMTDERIALLESVDFKWDAREARWHAMYEELKKHVLIHGPGKYPSAASRDWVRHQRKYYQGFREGKDVPLTAERLEKLRTLGVLF
ncbi:helicase [Fragilaria crotonensis]|nr:helicase [Fragilaria crotonensis]